MKEKNTLEQTNAPQETTPMGKTKKCKYCQSDIPKKATICPVCKKKQGAGCLQWFLGIFVIFIALGVLTGKNDGTSTNSSTTNNTPVETQPALSEEEFKAACIEADYKTLARNPEQYVGTKIVLTVKISQILQGGLFDNGTYYRVYTDTSGYGFYSGDEYFMYDRRVSDTTKLLQDDIITVYAEFAGTQTVTRALTNTKEDVPAIKAYYVDIIE